MSIPLKITAGGLLLLVVAAVPASAMARPESLPAEATVTEPKQGVTRVDVTTEPGASARVEVDRNTPVPQVSATTEPPTGGTVGLTCWALEKSGLMTQPCPQPPPP